MIKTEIIKDKKLGKSASFFFFFFFAKYVERSGTLL